jgi:Protein related to penicillin acylase
MRKIVAAVLLLVLLFIGFRAVGPVPPIGPFLDPANGVWASAAATNFPPLQDVALAGLRAPVQVLFDDRGVPHVFAASEDDAYRALGYVEARDRLFQMETQTRAAAGRLTEWAGQGFSTPIARIGRSGSRGPRRRSLRRTIGVRRPSRP